MTLDRTDIERIRDEATKLMYADWVVISDLATTALGLMDERGCCCRLLTHDVLAQQLRTAEARIRALEEGLREAVSEAHSHNHTDLGLPFPPKHGGKWSLCQDRMCVQARALLTSERRER